MALYADNAGIAIRVTRDIVVASIQADLDDDVLARLREDLLSRIQGTSSRAVILDVSGLDTIDSDEFAALRRLMTMSSIMGAESVLAGLQPGVVSALIEAGADVDGVRAAIDLDAAYSLLQPVPEEPPPEREAAADVDGDPDPAVDLNQDPRGGGDDSLRPPPSGYEQ